MYEIHSHLSASRLAGCCSRAADKIAVSSACSGNTRNASSASARSGNLLEVAWWKSTALQLCGADAASRPSP